MSQSALQSSVLLLNRSFTPVHLITAQRAFCLLLNAVAEVVNMEDGRLGLHNFSSWREISEFRRANGLTDGDSEWIATVSYEIEVPRILRLLMYNGFPKRRVSLNRRNIFARDSNRCQYCGSRFPTSELSLDHVVPLSQGGGTSWDNLVCACTRCNKRKGGRIPSQANMHLMREPREPRVNPQIKIKLRRKKYYSWRQFLDDAYWSVTLE
jgi:5-methylcytosine-specific restriction endonuclease McrA